MRKDNGAEALASMRIARTMRNDIAQAICPHLLRSLRFGAAPRARSASCVGGIAAAARLPRLLAARRLRRALRAACDTARKVVLF